MTESDAAPGCDEDEPTIDVAALVGAESDEVAADEATHPLTEVSAPVVLERVEGGAIALAALVATIVLFPSWWWAPFALFLLFDLSMLGYLRSPRTGAVVYNLVHNYTGPAIVGVTALIALWGSAPLAWWGGVLALSWAFHVGADRALGYGLKLPDAFEHTHLGWIGRAKR